MDKGNLGANPQSRSEPGQKNEITVSNLIKNKQTSDLSKVFATDDILGVPQAIKGFDKSDIREVISINRNALTSCDI